MFPCFQTLTWRNDCHKNDSHIKLWISHSFWKDFYLYVLSFMISYGKTTLFRISWGCRLLRCYLNSVNSSVARVYMLMYITYEGTALESWFLYFVHFVFVYSKCLHSYIFLTKTHLPLYQFYKSNKHLKEKRLHDKWVKKDFLIATELVLLAVAMVKFSLCSDTEDPIL